MVKKSTTKKKARTAAKTMVAPAGLPALVQRSATISRSKPKAKSYIAENFAIAEQLWVELEKCLAAEREARAAFDSVKPDRPEALYGREGEDYLPGVHWLGAEVDISRSGFTQLYVLAERKEPPNRFRAARAREILDALEDWRTKEQKLKNLTGLERAEQNCAIAQDAFTKQVRLILDGEAHTIHDIEMQAICLTHTHDLDEAGLEMVRVFARRSLLKTSLPLG